MRAIRFPQKTMYAYIDETGNTGGNIFDENQPDFVTAALLTKSNFDLLHKNRIKKLAQMVGDVELHGNEYGLGKIELIADGLLKIFKTANARFFIARAEKKYIAVSKLFDTLFDSFENKAVPWHVYNFRHFRLLLVFKLTEILREDVVKLFWEAIVEKNKKKSYQLFEQALNTLKIDAAGLSDKRAKELTLDAVNWAIKNPESIYIHTNSKAVRAGHLPNVAIFPNLLQGIETFSKKWKRPVREIVHDQQSQFQNILKDWHDMYSNAAAGVIELPLGEKHQIRRVSGSTFIIKNSSESAGIQAIDIVLWLFKKVLQGKSLPLNSARLMNHVFRFGYHDDFSFTGVGQSLEQEIETINNKPLDDSDLEKGKEMLKELEIRRQEAMQEHEIKQKK